MFTFRTLNLAIRTFTKPAVNITKGFVKAESKKESKAKDFFLWMGNRNLELDNWIKAKTLNLANKDFFGKNKPADHVITEKGIEFFFEIFTYAIMFFLPIYELYVIQNDSNQQSKKLNERLKKIEDQIKQSEEANQILVSAVEKANQIQEEIDNDVIINFEQKALKQIEENNKQKPNKQELEKLDQGQKELLKIEELKSFSTQTREEIIGILGKINAFMVENTLGGELKVTVATNAAAEPLPEKKI